MDYGHQWRRTSGAVAWVCSRIGCTAGFIGDSRPPKGLCRAAGALPRAAALAAPIIGSTSRTRDDNVQAEIVSRLETAWTEAETRAEGLQAPVVFEPESDYDAYGAELTGEEAGQAIDKAYADGVAQGLKRAAEIARKVKQA